MLTKNTSKQEIIRTSSVKEVKKYHFCKMFTLTVGQIKK